MLYKTAVATIVLGIAAITQGGISMLSVSDKSCREATQVNDDTGDVADCPSSIQCNDAGDTCLKRTKTVGNVVYTYCRCDDIPGTPVNDGDPLITKPWPRAREASSPRTRTDKAA
jgi:hypothetical protein